MRAPACVAGPWPDHAHNQPVRRRVSADHGNAPGQASSRAVEVATGRPAAGAHATAPGGAARMCCAQRRSRSGRPRWNRAKKVGARRQPRHTLHAMDRGSSPMSCRSAWRPRRAGIQCRGLSLELLCVRQSSHRHAPPGLASRHAQRGRRKSDLHVVQSVVGRGLPRYRALADGTAPAALVQAAGARRPDRDAIDGTLEHPRGHRRTIRWSTST